jgi:hypothetical protein
MLTNRWSTLAEPHDRVMLNDERQLTRATMIENSAERPVAAARGDSAPAAPKRQRGTTVRCTIKT